MADPGASVSPWESSERNHAIVRARHQGKVWREIAVEYGLSIVRVREIYRKTVGELPPGEIQEYRQDQLERIDMLRNKLWEVVNTPHYVTTQAGKLIDGPDGGYLRDSGPIIAAVGKLIALEERTARLLGLDSPTKHALEVEQVTYNIVGVDVSTLT